MFPELSGDQQFVMADLGSKVGRGWMNHIPYTKSDPSALADEVVVLQIRLRLGAGMDVYGRGVTDAEGRCSGCRENPIWTPAHALACASQQRTFSRRHTRVKYALGNILSRHRCKVLYEQPVDNSGPSDRRKLRADILVQTGIEGGPLHIDTAVVGPGHMVWAGKVRVTAADIKNAKCAHAARMARQDQPEPEDDEYVLVHGEQSLMTVVDQAEERKALFNPGRAFAVRKLVRSRRVRETVGRKCKHYSCIEELDDGSQFLAAVFSVGGTMSAPVARLVNGLVKHSGLPTFPGFRVNPHPKAAMGRLVFRRLSTVFANELAVLFNGGRMLRLVSLGGE